MKMKSNRLLAITSLLAFSIAFASAESGNGSVGADSSNLRQNHDIGKSFSARIESLPDSNKEVKEAGKKYIDAVAKCGQNQEQCPPDSSELTRSILTNSNMTGENRRQTTNEGSALCNQMKDYQCAKLLATDSLGHDHNDTDALRNYAEANYGLHDYQAAIAAETRLANLDPNNGTVYTTRAMAHYESGEYLAAIEDSRRALALDKNNDTAFATLRLAESKVTAPNLKLDEHQRAEAAALKQEYEAVLEQETQEEAAARMPADTAAGSLVQQAAQMAARGDSRAAVDAATRAIEQDPKDAEAYDRRAAAYNIAGDYVKAVTDASKALALNPSDIGALDARANAYLFLGRPQDALEDCSRAIGFKPDDAFAYASCGKAQAKLGRSESALENYQNAAALNPEFQPEYRMAAASIHYERPVALPPPVAVMARPSPETGTPRPPMSPFKRYLLVLACTLGGGALVAAGILDIATRLRKPASPAATHSGLRIENYEILRTLGQGGMGVVYEALDRTLGRTVAVKKLRDEIKLDSAERDRFLDEARTVAALRHPSIVEIHTILEEGDDLYLIFEFMPGKTAAQLIEDRGCFSLSEAKRVAYGVCQALEYAHRHGVVHRDLKPSNIMVAEDGQIKVMDFGIARQAKDSMEKTGAVNVVIGTPQYMAPEAEQGVVRKECDVYALGVCLYEMLVGQPPFAGMTMEAHKLAMDYIRPSAARPGLPVSLDRFMDGALHADPEQRIKTPTEFMTRLAAATEPALT